MSREGLDVVNVYITIEQKDLEDLAWRNHTTVSGLLRTLIEMALETPAEPLGPLGRSRDRGTLWE